MHKNSENRKQEMYCQKPGRPSESSKLTDSLTSTKALKDLSHIKNVVSTSQFSGWKDHSEGNQVRFVLVTNDQPLTVTHCVIINADFRTEEVPKNCSVFVGTVSTLKNEDDVYKLFKLVSDSIICAGHPDDHFVEMRSSKCKVQSSGEYIDNSTPVLLNRTTCVQTI